MDKERRRVGGLEVMKNPKRVSSRCEEILQVEVRSDRIREQEFQAGGLGAKVILGYK